MSPPNTRNTTRNRNRRKFPATSKRRTAANSDDNGRAKRQSVAGTASFAHDVTKVASNNAANSSQVHSNDTSTATKSIAQDTTYDVPTKRIVSSQTNPGETQTCEEISTPKELPGNPDSIRAVGSQRVCRSCLTLRDRINELETSLKEEKSEAAKLSTRVNDLKSRLQLSEVDKGNDRHFIATLRDQAQRLQNENKRLDRLCNSMERVQQDRVLAKCGSSGSRKREGRVERLRRIVSGLHKDYRPVAHDVAQLWRRKIMEDMFELSEECGDAHPVREWLLNDEPSSRVEFLSLSETERGSAIIPFEDGNGAVPRCPIELANNPRMYTSRWKTPREFNRSIIINVLESQYQELFTNGDNSSVGISNDNLLNETADIINKALISEFSALESNLRSDWKKKLKCTFLSGLGYSALGRIGSLKGDAEKKNEERSVLSNRLLKWNDDGDICCSWWRMGSFKDLRYSEGIEEPDGFQPDHLFKNPAAVLAYEELRGYNLGDDDREKDATILSLARADAFMSASLKCARQPMKPGGKTGEKHADEFQRLLPRACEELLQTCGRKLQDHYPESFSSLPPSASSVTPNIFSVSRGGSTVFRMPSTKLFYLAITPSFFNDNISEKLGNVLDCYVGWMKVEEDKFQEVRKDMHTVASLAGGVEDDIPDVPIAVSRIDANDIASNEEEIEDE